MSADSNQGKVILCSECLLGVPCRFDGRDKQSAAVLRFLEGREVVPICPEAASGMGIPRPAVHIEGEGADRRWVDAAGRDRTLEFQRGAMIALEAARTFGATMALLKEGSPSCGCQRIFGSNGAQAGRGATAQALSEAGVQVISDEEVS